MPLEHADPGVGAALGRELTRIACLLARAAAPEAEADPLEGAGLEPGPIAALGTRLGLGRFETDLLAFAVGAELNADVAALAARIAGDPRATFASFGVAFAALPAPDWRAAAPDRPLRRLRLVTLTAPDRLLSSELRLDERTLHALFGDDGMDPRLAPYLRVETRLPQPSPGLARHASRLRDAVARAPVVAVMGRHPADIRVAAAAALPGRPLARLALADLPAMPTERETFARLWEREARLTGAALLVEGEGSAAALAHLLDGQPGPVLVAGREPPEAIADAPAVEIPAPDRAEQASLWRRALGARARRMNGGIDLVSQSFDLAETRIGALAAQVAEAEPAPDRALWRACRAAARPRLGMLAERIEPAAGWDDIVLPAQALATLHALAAQLRGRHRVHEEWGFARRPGRGLGLTALFAGPSGTGKTMAAEVIARAVDLDLFRIDLSAVVSKYIGETEKNLRAVFDAAEGAGAVLLFDEADALFGKRSEVGDAHDRYANIEVGYLLQRMESYSGLAILTTNMRAALDEAFARRIRFTVTFPFPSQAARLRIWRGVFPREAALGALSWEKLARLELSAGHIRNVALNAAFLAAEDGGAIEMKHLLASAVIECANIDKPLTPTEIAGWTP